MPWSDGGSDRPLALPQPFPALGFERNGIQLHQVVATRNGPDGVDGNPLRPDWTP